MMEEKQITFPLKTYQMVGDISYRKDRITDYTENDLIGYKETYSISLRGQSDITVSGESFEEAMTKFNELLERRKKNGIKD